MLPKGHILLGLLFCFIMHILFPEINLFILSIIFASSVLIDFDHYLAYFLIKKDFSLKKAYKYFINLKYLFTKNKKMKLPLCLFHTIEFLFVLAFLSLFSKLIFYIFIGFLFHSIVDFIYLIHENLLFMRQFSLIAWIKNNKR